MTPHSGLSAEQKTAKGKRPKNYEDLTPESLVVSLDLARQLKEAGWEQEESIFWLFWSDTHDEGWIEYGSIHSFDSGAKSMYKRGAVFAAPTAEEILRRLPKHLNAFGQHGRLTVQFGLSQSQWQPCVGYIHHKSNNWIFQGDNYQDGMMYFVDTDSLANAAAQMWLYLKKNNLLPSLP